MARLYERTCSSCGGWLVRLAAGDKKPAFAESVFVAAAEHVRAAGGWKTNMVMDKPVLALRKETQKWLAQAVDYGIKDSVVPDVMRAELQKDIFMFSGLKSHASLKEAALLMSLPDGSPRPFESFKAEVLKLNSTYNVHYLEAEYLFARQSAQQAANWVADTQGVDPAAYLLQYRTAADDRVRDSHAALHNTTLPHTSAFWASYYPPNGWRCRCRAIKVRAGKYPETDEGAAIAAGEKATTALGKDGKNKLAIFRFNPGAQAVIMPPSHPYTQVAGAQQAKAAMKTKGGKLNAIITQSVKTDEDLNEVMRNLAAAHPNLFKRGFKTMLKTSSRQVNGKTDCNGTIWLRSARHKLVKEGMTNIYLGRPTTYDQEDALSTLWHEIWHNRAVRSYNLSKRRTQQMELVNELASRLSLEDFMTMLGGKLQNRQLITDRPSTGYNNMVRNYVALADAVNVPKDVLRQRMEQSVEKVAMDSQGDVLVQTLEGDGDMHIPMPDAYVNMALDYPHFSFTQQVIPKILLVKKGGGGP